MKAENTVSHKESRTIAFRVSEEQYHMIQMMSDVSGMIKQDYLLSRVLQKEVIVTPNVRVKKYLEQYLREIVTELQRIGSGESMIPDLIDRLTVLIDMAEEL